MGKEGLKVQGKVTLKLYDKNGHLKVGSPKKKPKSRIDKVLSFLLEAMEEEPG